MSVCTEVIDILELQRLKILKVTKIYCLQIAFKAEIGHKN